MGRYVLLGFGLVTLIIAVDTASGRRLGCPAATPDICYTCPIPSFAGSHACQSSSVAVACPSPCQTPCDSPCGTVAVAACGSPPVSMSDAEQTPAPQHGADETSPQPDGDASSDSSILSSQSATPDDATSGDAASAELSADEATSSVQTTPSSEQSTPTGEVGSRYTERPQASTPATRPLFRRPSIEGVLPNPTPQPAATFEAAEGPATLTDPTPTDSIPTDPTPTDATWADPTPANDSGDEVKEPETEDPETKEPETQEPEGGASEEAPAETDLPKTDPPEKEVPGELSDEDFFGAASMLPKRAAAVSLEMPTRQWSDASGLYECEAQLVGVNSRGVLLQTADGGQQVVAWARLSTTDLEHLRDQINRVRTLTPAGEVIAGGY